MAPLYRKALIIGGTSGIGLSFATHLIKQGTSVIVTGRRASNLSTFVSTHGDLAHKYELDVLAPAATLASFAKTVTAEHTDIDLIVFNAGIQRPFDFTSPNADLSTFEAELTTNYTSVVTLWTALLPFMLSRPHETTAVFMSATLGLVPTMLRTPGYNASKAAMHSWLLNVREQMRRSPDTACQKVKLVEVFPPAVQTELHDEKHQPDLVNGGQIGMPLEVFTGLMWEGLQNGDDEVYVGDFPKAVQAGPEKARREMFVNGIDGVEKGLSQFMKA